MVAVISANTFEGYVPDADPRQAKGLAVLVGKNFIQDVEGPRAAFGNRVRYSQPFDAASGQRVYELTVGEETFIGAPTGIWKYDQISGLPQLLLEVTTTKACWPWTVAYCGRKYYFAQYEIGLWEYDPATSTIRHVVTPIFDGAIGVCTSSGRLCILSADYILWSAQDDGSDLTPALATGAGAQAVSKIGGTAYRIDAVVDGVIVATSAGLLKGTLVDQVYVFEWRPLSADVKLFSPNGACNIPDAGMVYLDTHGLHLRSFTAAALEPPELWQDALNAYFKKTYLNNPYVKNPGNLLFYYSGIEQLLFVGFSITSSEGQIPNAFCFYVPTKMWGRFDHACRGLLTLQNAAGYQRLGYLDLQGYFRILADDAFVDGKVQSFGEFIENSYNKPSERDTLIYATDVDANADGVPDHNIDGTVTQTLLYSCDDELWYSEVDPLLYTAGVATGFYTEQPVEFFDTLTVVDFPTVFSSGVWSAATDLCFTEDGASVAGLAAFSLDAEHLDSTLTIGPMRITSQQRFVPQEQDTFEFVSVGTSALSVPATTEDWNVEGTDEDWNSAGEDEDWGVLAGVSNVFQAALTMTLDSHQAVFAGEELLFTLEQSSNAVLYSTRGTVGLYGLLRLYTEQPYDFIYLKTLEISGQPVGYNY